jgi:hypothetical protein
MAIKAASVTLVGNVVSTVALTGNGRALRVSATGTNPVYFRTDSVDPVLGADECMVLLGGASRIVPVPQSKVIKFRCTSTPTVTVELEG